jgi:hypothetical protein
VRAPLPPRDPGADPVGREQGGHRPAGAGLAAAEGVGGVEHRAQRHPGVGALRLLGHREEAAEREAHRALEGLAQARAQGSLAEPVAVLRDPGPDGVHGAAGDVLQALPHGLADRRVEREPAVHLFPPNNPFL